VSLSCPHGTLEERRCSSSFLTSAQEGGEWSASRPGLIYPRRRSPVPTVQEAGWAPEPVWTQRLEEKSSAPVGDRTPVVQSVLMHCIDWATLVHVETLLLCRLKMAVFWVVPPCILVEVHQLARGACCLHHQGDGGGSKDLCNVGNMFLDYTMLQHRKQPFSHSRPCSGAGSGAKQSVRGPGRSIQCGAPPSDF
jgi:hypothetical protein